MVKDGSSELTRGVGDTVASESALRSLGTFCRGHAGGISGTVARESALRSAAIFLSRVRAMPSAPWPDGRHESLRSPCCGLAYTNTKPIMVFC
ncbi:hypothetical protein PoB_004632100 [Plakobranchus ocellatus]|uniref:Uncharacterized protein n=1 Tax=Plakobranchus ocellatus TaxID=259542 RepID=A0AAV4BLE5_9GAST|nr:hypothetical protein PoB_004632100 [Plakobranchus ocellatus]